jgi:hypothetical protein
VLGYRRLLGAVHDRSERSVYVAQNGSHVGPIGERPQGLCDRLNRGDGHSA